MVSHSSFILIQGFPLTPGAQYIEDGIGTHAIQFARPAAAKAVSAHMHRQQRLQNLPQCIRDPEAGCRLVIRRLGTSPFAGLLFVHAHHYASYPDRLSVQQQSKGCNTGP